MPDDNAGSFDSIQALAAEIMRLDYELEIECDKGLQGNEGKRLEIIGKTASLGVKLARMIK